MSARRERQLGWVTSDQVRYGAPHASDWIDAIKRQVCPLCGAGPYVIVASHISRVHGIDQYELRDLLGVPYTEKICDPELSKSRSAEKLANPEKWQHIMQPRGTPGGRGKSWAAQHARRRPIVTRTDRQYRSKYVGVFPTDGSTTWTCRAMVDGRRVVASGYITELDAALAYDNLVEPSSGLRPNGTAPAEPQRAMETTRQRQSRERAELILRDWASGSDLSELTSRYGLKEATIRSVLRQAGITPPHRPTAPPRRMVQFTCPSCGEAVSRRLRDMHKHKQPWTCSRSCGAVQRELRRRAGEGR